MSDDVKELQKGITDILVAIGKIETEIKLLSSINNRVSSLEKDMIEVTASSKSAHKRIDGIVESIKEEKKEEKNDKKWLYGVFLSVAALLWKLIEYITQK